MRRICGKKLTFAVVASLLAGTVPAGAEAYYDPDTKTTTIDGDEVYGGFYGGRGSGYTLAIIGGTTRIKVGGGYNDSQRISGGIGQNGTSDNKLEVSGTGALVCESDTSTFGGIALSGIAERNRVEFKSSAISKIEELYGGFSYDGQANNNEIAITSGTVDVNQGIWGGEGNSTQDNTAANSNTVRIEGDAEVAALEINGGLGSNAANRNQVIINTSKPIASTWGIMAGKSWNEASDNLLSVKDSQMENSCYLVGGFSESSSNRNAVSLKGKTTISSLGIAGGFIFPGPDDDHPSEAKENQISIDSSTVATAVVIGGGAAMKASQNFLDLKGTVNSYLLAGAGAFNGADVGVAGGSDVTGNVVNLAGAELVPIKLDDPLIKDYTESEDYKPYVGWLKKPGESVHVAGGALLVGGKAKDNTVNLSGTMDLSQANLYGWITGPEILKDPSKMDEFFERQLDTTVEHSGNTLNVGYTAKMTTDKDGNASITGKGADWHGSKVQGIYNFDKIAFYNVDHSQPALTVTDTVSLPDNVTLDLDHFTPSSSPEDSVIQDDVLIDASGASTVKGLDKLYESGKDKYQQPVTRTYANGGVTVMGKDGLALSADNKLYYGLHSLDNITYNTIDWQTNGTVLTLTDSRKFDLANTKVHTENIGFTAKSLESITKAGDYSMTLLDTQGNKTLAAGNLTTKQGKWNISNALEGTGIASLDTNGNVIYTMDTVQKKNGTEIKVDTSKQTHNALIANEAGLGILAAGRDRLDSVLTNFNGQEGGVFTFASLGGSKDTYDTGSESKTYTWNGLVGIGNEAATKDGDFSYGLFYEYGKGHYSVDGAGYTGSGDAHYNGGGLMAKYMARNKNYVEGSLHFGNLKNNADSVLHSSDGSAYGYNTSSNYWSGHVGFGHIFDLTDKVESTSLGGTQRAARDLDVYGKYFYTYVGGDSFRAGEANYQLDGMNSSLLRIGARVNNRSGWNNYYYGLAWDYEFDGESNGTVSAAGLSAPIRKADIGGSSLMAEAGWKLESNQENPWEVNLSMQAYAGQHKGLGGNVYMAYHF